MTHRWGVPNCDTSLVREEDQDRAPPDKVTLTDIFLLVAELFQRLNLLINDLINDLLNFGSMTCLSAELKTPRR